MGKFIRAITDRLGVLFDPPFWVRLGRVSHDYDESLNNAIDKHGIRRVGLAYATAGGPRIWVSNYPYAFGHPAQERGGSYTLPRRATAKRIKRMLDSSFFERATNGDHHDEG